MLSSKNDVIDVNYVMHYQVDVNAARIKKKKNNTRSCLIAWQMLVT